MYSDRGGATQIYRINLFKALSEAEPVAVVTMVTERVELGPEMPKSSNSAWLLCGDHLTPSKGACCQVAAFMTLLITRTPKKSDSGGIGGHVGDGDNQTVPGVAP